MKKGMHYEGMEEKWKLKLKEEQSGGKQSRDNHMHEVKYLSSLFPMLENKGIEKVDN